VSALALSAFAGFALTAPALAADFDITSGTVTTPQTLDDGQSGKVASGAALSIRSGGTAAVTWASGSVVITNSGLIQQLGTGRAFDSSGAVTSRNLTFTNTQGAVVKTVGQDAVRINTNITSGSVVIDNAGLIQASGSGFAPKGQALDLRALNTAGVTVTVTNRSTGTIEALSDDALRPALNATIINAGIIRSFGANTSGGADGTADAIDAGARTGVVVTNQAGGLISGARHGITADTDITVSNEAGGTIIGRNGSGVGSDGNGTVINYGTITGDYAGAANIINSSGLSSANGDGDGVDIDLIGLVTNFGIIEGKGAGGVDSGGNPNNSEGIAMGGGSIVNAKGALISGATRGILIDNGSGGSAWGAVTIDNAGTIRGLTGSAITVVGAFTNSITNSGLITGAGAGPVIGTGVGDDTLTNSGTINGSVDLGIGANTFSNLTGGRLNAGTLLAPGAGRTLANAGTIAPGGDSAIVTTALTGKLSQTGTGNLAIDLNAASNTADRVDVSEDASLNGSVTLSVAGLAISSGSVTVLTATGGVSHPGLGLIASPALQASLVYPDANTVKVAYALSFAPTGIGLNENQTSLGKNLNDAVIANPASLSGITTALLALTTNGAYVSALNQLSPEIYGDGAVSNLYAAHAFGNSLLSCRSRDAAYVGVSEDQCLWAAISGRDYQQDATARGLGYDEQTWGVSGGGQVSIAPNLVLGIAAGIEQGNGDTSSGASSETDRANAGAALKHTSGPWLIAGAVFGGTGSTDTTRPIGFGGLATTATGDQDVSHLSGRLRVAYQAGGNALYLKPMVDLEATQLWLGSVQEQGGVGALSIASSEETIFSAAPALELGGQMALAGGTLLRPFVRVGAIAYSEDEIAFSSSFIGAPAGIPSFLTRAEVEDVMGNVGAGLDVMWTDSSTVKLNYDGLFGEDTQQHAFGAKASVKF
jgi:outer membrane autotransporter protein